MPNITPELGLALAVDSDDTATYLETNLGGSLTTVDSLFNNTSGHTHSGAHQGGPITSAGVADGSLTNAKLGPDVERNQLLTNGGFEIWQRGNGPFAANQLTADRWTSGMGAGGTASISRDATNIDTSGGGLYAAAVTYTHGTGESYFYQPTYNETPHLKGRTISFSIRVRTSTANAVRPCIYDGAFTYGAYHSGDGTWQTLTVTRAVGTGATGADVRLALNASCTAYVDNACLVVGSQPANYVPLHPADDLARCQRYYKRYAATSTIPIPGGQAYSAGGFVTTLLMAPQLAVVPTLTVSAAGDWETSAANLAYIQCSSLAANVLHAQSCQLIGGVASGLVAGNATNLQNVSGNSWLAFEANP